MAKINEAERKTQDRVFALFRDQAALGYVAIASTPHR